MNKDDLTDSIYQAHGGMSYTDARLIVDLILTIIKERLTRGEKVVLSGFGTFRVAIADPPWSYKNSGCRGAAADQYSTMSIEDICSLPVGELMAKDSVLLLWATWPNLAEAFRVMAAWGGGIALLVVALLTVLHFARRRPTPAT